MSDQELNNTTQHEGTHPPDLTLSHKFQNKVVQTEEDLEDGYRPPVGLMYLYAILINIISYFYQSLISFYLNLLYSRVRKKISGSHSNTTLHVDPNGIFKTAALMVVNCC